MQLNRFQLTTRPLIGAFLCLSYNKLLLNLIDCAIDLYSVKMLVLHSVEVNIRKPNMAAPWFNRYTNEDLNVSKTLKELKAENALLEQAEAEEAPQADNAEAELEEAVEVVEDGSQEDAETDSAETDTETEAWMQTEEEGVEPKFTDSDIGAAKRKLRAKLEKKHESETEALRAEIEALKNKPTTAQPAPTNKPKREDFYSEDDPDEAYTDALVDWRLNNQASQQSKQAEEEALKRKTQEQMNQVAAKVDDHYTRAAELTKTSGISEDVYRQADQNVRQTVESVIPNLGDAVTDALISKIGSDSEKVMYYLGRNKTKLLEFEKALRNDSSGIEAALMLGEIKRDLTAPLKRKSNAPTPAPSLKGDENSSDNSSAWLRKYKDAHTSKDSQKAFNIKREAKKAGVNTRNW